MEVIRDDDAIFRNTTLSGHLTYRSLDRFLRTTNPPGFIAIPVIS